MRNDDEASHRWNSKSFPLPCDLGLGLKSPCSLRVRVQGFLLPLPCLALSCSLPLLNNIIAFWCFVFPSFLDLYFGNFICRLQCCCPLLLLLPLLFWRRGLQLPSFLCATEMWPLPPRFHYRQREGSLFVLICWTLHHTLLLSRLRYHPIRPRISWWFVYCFDRELRDFVVNRNSTFLSLESRLSASRYIV